MPTIAIFTPVETVYGMVYKPVNVLAKNMAGLAGLREITEDRMMYVHAIAKVEYKS